jgi:alpha,alpha-trehalose phosphorylase
MAFENQLNIEDWRIVESSPDLARRAARESIFAVGNGYLGLRGTPEEGAPAHDPGAILNGFHETWPIAYPEDAFGMARTGQTAVAATDGTILRLFADGEQLDLSRSSIQRFERVLDMGFAVLTREVEWTTRRGARLLVRSRRLASLDDRHLAALSYDVVALDRPVAVTISSELVTPAPAEASDDPRRGRGFEGKVLEGLAARVSGHRAVLALATRASGLGLAVGMDHAISHGTVATADAYEDGAQVVFRAAVEPGRPLRLSKYVAYHWAGEGDLETRVNHTLDRAAAAGYDAIERRQRHAANAFWQRCDVQVDGPAGLQGTVRFNLFALLQAAACVQGHGVAAKGVSGHGYEGHYFWDTEVYVVPFLTHTHPRWARDVLAFRCAMLDDARGRARELGHRGALFPWRTINGQEASARYVAGTAQYHINADVAHALRKYRAVTGDDGPMLAGGADVLVETARFWCGLGFFSEGRGFCINGVTGPDEYTTIVDNNAYTNVMARENLEAAADVVEELRADHPAAFERLVAATGLTELEPAAWRRAAARMYVPADAERGIVLQDDGFLERKRWDFAGTPAERYPLLRHYHPLEIFRHQVIKQADVVLATYLAWHRFSEDEIRRTFDYYDPLTTGDSTLSACIQSVVAAAVDQPEAALRYFRAASSVDLGDAHGNTADGLHIASCGGTWLALVAGFGGLRDFDGEPRFAPRLPAEWTRLSFRVELQGRRLEVELTLRATTYTLRSGEALTLRHFGEPVRVARGEPVRRPVRVAPAQAAA